MSAAGRVFSAIFPDLPVSVDPTRTCVMGLRSVDPAERRALNEAGGTVHDVRTIDEHDIASLLRAFLALVENANSLLHVSHDVDFLDPSIAPAVGTTGAWREAHLVM